MTANPTNPLTEIINPRWTGLAIVAATGPSFTVEIAEQLRGYNVIAVNDAYKLLPFAPVMYACDVIWWKHHGGCMEFAGEKWSSHGLNANDKSQIKPKFGLRLVNGMYSKGFSIKNSTIHYGSNSGFQAVNLAILFGATRIALVGFDMQIVNGKQHFFGSHPRPLNQVTAFGRFIEAFKVASQHMPPGVTIINCTPGSALKCFPYKDLKEVLSDGFETSNAA